MMGYEGAGWGGGFWMFGEVLLIIGLVVLVVWAVSAASRAGRPGQDSSRPTPNEILRERFARGEISEQEFEQARKVLGSDR
ncbi:MAG: SHOCT domain-containing protein [Chloroflexi bacterium]|nr:SHOCT domain-containing protein [Chloroflexota bacterium]